MIPSRVYMVGIGGIGMSALAQFLKHAGHEVSGSDRDASPTTDLLAKKGIPVFVGHDECLIPADAGLLIYSDAVPSSNRERVRAAEMGVGEMSYFEALGEVSRSARTIAVAGTHGKTTTTGMLAKILHDAGAQPTAVVGSIVQDFESNFLPGRKDLFIVEACEYRDHVLKLSPEILVITNIELDHTDYFPNLAVLQETFRKAACAVSAHGCIVTNPSDPNIASVIGDTKARIVDYTNESVPTLNLIGEFNRMNARAAKAAARAAFPDISEIAIDAALTSFRGSWRRFEYKGETPSGSLVYDDYAHHPTAIEKTIEAARVAFPDKRIILVFHPHLYSRTRDLFDDFARAIARADRTLLAPIYAAREEDRGDVSSDALAAAARQFNPHVVSLPSFDAIRSALLSTALEKDLIITMGAGDIYKVAEQIAGE